MSIGDYYERWKLDNEGLNFIEYYNKYNDTRWDRLNRQRNYKRNKDIIYKLPTARRGDERVTYRLIGINDGYFYFYDQFLRYRYDKGKYDPRNAVEYIRPYTYITMNVNEDLKLEADIPILVEDAKFTIKDGNLIFEANE